MKKIKMTYCTMSVCVVLGTMLLMLVYIKDEPGDPVTGELINLNRYPNTMSELAQPVKRYPGVPEYSDIIFSPRRTDWGPYDIVEVADAFHATRIDWLYVHDRDGALIRQLEDLGISSGMALNNLMWDTVEYRPSPIGFEAKPEYYTEGRMLNIDGKISNGHGSINDPAYGEIMKRWLRLFKAFDAQRIQFDNPGFDFKDWDFNPHALQQFNNYLATKVLPDELERLGISDPLQFDLKSYMLNRTQGNGVPVELKKWWENFRLETLLAWYSDLREWANEIIGPDVAFSANYSSFIQFSPEHTWSDYAITELQPSGGQFGIGNPWSLYRKVRIARELGKALVVTLGTHDVYENKIMAGLTYAMGIHMITPYGVYMKNEQRRFDDPKIYSDIYDFVDEWGETYLDGYEEAFAFGNGIIHPLTQHESESPPIMLEDASNDVYTFVRAKPGEADAPVVIHMVNWSKTEHSDLALTIDPGRFFPGRGLKVTLLRPGSKPELLSDGWQARIKLPSPHPWQMLVVEPATKQEGRIWAPEAATATYDFFDKHYAILFSRSRGAEITYTTDGSEPSAESARYTRPIKLLATTTLKARSFKDGQFSPVSILDFAKQEPNAIPIDSGALKPGVTYELRQGIKVDTLPDRDDPMAWEEAKYKFDAAGRGVLERIVIPADAPKSQFLVIYEGYIGVPRDGFYTFYCNADDECRVDIDDERLLNESGRKVPPDLSMIEMRGQQLLSKGWHKIRIEYLQMYDQYGLDLQWEGPQISKQPITPVYLMHE